MKKSNILILAVTAFFMFPDPAHSQNGPDPVRAGMFKLYAKTATKALVAQDAVERWRTYHVQGRGGQD